VIATAGPANQGYLTSLGATATVYGDGLVERIRVHAPAGVNAIFDIAGKGALDDSITLRGGTERTVTIADFRARQLGIPFSTGSGSRPVQRIEEVARDVADGALITTYPLDQAAAAQDASETGHSRGKLVLTVN
jgi:NADPH:quinone reductase-like Zn-dependent oxidoreductase